MSGPTIADLVRCHEKCVNEAQLYLLSEFHCVMQNQIQMPIDSHENPNPNPVDAMHTYFPIKVHGKFSLRWPCLPHGFWKNLEKAAKYINISLLLLLLNYIISPLLFLRTEVLSYRRELKKRLEESSHLLATVLPQVRRLVHITPVMLNAAGKRLF